MEKIDEIGSDLLGVELKKTVESPLDKALDSVTEEIGEPPVGTGKEPVIEEKKGVESLDIENLQEVIAKVKEENELKRTNPSILLEGESGINFIDGEPHLVIDNAYVPHDKAQIILQTRKVVREYLKLQNLIKGIKEE